MLLQTSFIIRKFLSREFRKELFSWLGQDACVENI
jgi:hypothetical protein